MITISQPEQRGHPWTQKGKWERIYIEGNIGDTLTDTLGRLQSEGWWACWVDGQVGDTGRPGAVLYRPVGVRGPWCENKRVIDQVA